MLSLSHLAVMGWMFNYPDSKVPGDNIGPIWVRQDPGGPHVGPRNFAIWIIIADAEGLVRT